MSKFLTPEDSLNPHVEEFNKGNIDFLMTLYEKDACFVSEPGQVINELENLRKNLQGFINMRVRLEAKVKRVIHASDLALLITEWSITGTEPADGNPINSVWPGYYSSPSTIRWNMAYGYRKSLGHRLINTHLGYAIR